MQKCSKISEMCKYLQAFFLIIIYYILINLSNIYRNIIALNFFNYVVSTINIWNFARFLHKFVPRVETREKILKIFLK